MSAELDTERIYLIGPRGSGKSTVARLLAEQLGWEWADADAELEARAGCSIRAIFAAEGEEGFRRRESEVVAILCRRQRLVLATGGGVVLREANREHLRSGLVVWLTAEAGTLWQRISGDASTAERRPALTGGGGKSEVELLLRMREPLYRACAALTVDTTNLSPEAATLMILSSLANDH